MNLQDQAANVIVALGERALHHLHQAGRQVGKASLRACLRRDARLQALPHRNQTAGDCLYVIVFLGNAQDGSRDDPGHLT